MTPAIKCLILLAVVALLFVTEMIPAGNDRGSGCYSLQCIGPGS